MKGAAPRSAQLASGILACFLARRVTLLLAALGPRRPLSELRREPPEVTLVVPAHNEETGIRRTLAAIDALAYPDDRLFVVLVDDGSTDSTAAHLRTWVAGRARARVLALPARGGKWEAVNRAIALAPETELVFVCDADLRPREDCLTSLVEPFGDPNVGATSAFLSPDNAERSLVARYAALESWVNQLVTSAGKDRLDICPPALGASVYRRSALEQVGWFPVGVPGGDVRITLALAQRGWRTRFVAAAVADNEVADRWSDYWHQHERWARNMLSSRHKRHGSRTAAGWGGRLESVLSAAGYADRLALVAALALGRLASRLLSGAYLMVRAVEVVLAVRAAGSPNGWRFLLAASALFPMDVLASVAAVALHVTRRQRGWRRPPRGRS